MRKRKNCRYLNGVLVCGNRKKQRRGVSITDSDGISIDVRVGGVSLKELGLC